MLRKIIEINEELCNGCGACASACHEGAIGMVGGKAKLLRDDYCDGLGDCLPVCPTDAIHFVEREAEEYDKAAVLTAQEKNKVQFCHAVVQAPMQRRFTGKRNVLTQRSQSSKAHSCDNGRYKLN